MYCFAALSAGLGSTRQPRGRDSSWASYSATACPGLACAAAGKSSGLYNYISLFIHNKEVHTFVFLYAKCGLLAFRQKNLFTGIKMPYCFKKPP